MSSIQPTVNPQVPSAERPPHRGIAGLFLVVIGVVALAYTLTQQDLPGVLFLPALGLLFLAWGILRRQVGPLVPGGVLLGIGVGVLVTGNDFVHSGSQEHAPILLLCVGLGFALITLLSLLFTARRFWWPLLPAALLVALSVALFLGGTPLEVARVIGTLWSLVLVEAGLFLLWEWYWSGQKS